MIRIEQVATREVRVCWDKGSEFQFLVALKKAIVNRNELEKRCDKK